MNIYEQAIFTANALDNIVRKCKEDFGAEDASPVVLEALSSHAADLRNAAMGTDPIGMECLG